MSLLILRCQALVDSPRRELVWRMIIRLNLNLMNHSSLQRLEVVEVDELYLYL